MKTYLALLESFDLLTEDRIDFLKQQFKDKLSTDHDQLGKHKDSDKIIDHFATKADPSTNKAHTQWLVGQYSKGNIRQEDAPQLKSTLNDFALVKDRLEKKDIAQYKDVGELRDAISTQKGVAQKKIKEKKSASEDKAAEMEKLYDSDGVTGHRIPNKDVSIKNYGPGGAVKSTNWCTAANSDNNMFNSYKGGKYTMHFPNDEVLQFHHQSGQIMDSNDRQVERGDSRFAPYEHHIAKFIDQTKDAEKGESKILDRFKHFEPHEIEDALGKHEKAIQDNGGEAINKYHRGSQHEALNNIASTSKLSNEHFDRLNKLPQKVDYFGNLDHNPDHELSKNPNLTHDRVDKLINHPNEKVATIHAQNLAKNPAVEGKHIDRLMQTHANNETVLGGLAKNPNLQPHHIDQLMKSNVAMHRLADNHHIELPIHHQEAIMNDGAYQGDFASRKDLHPSIVDRLVKSDPSGLAVKKLIENPHANLSHEHIMHILHATTGNLTRSIMDAPHISPETKNHAVDYTMDRLREKPFVSNGGAYSMVKSRAFTKDHLNKLLDHADAIDQEHNNTSKVNYARHYASEYARPSSEQLTRQIDGLKKIDDSVTSSTVSNLLNTQTLKPAHIKSIMEIPLKTYHVDSILDHPSTNADILHSVYDKGDNWGKTQVLHHDNVQLSHFKKAMDGGDHKLHGAISSAPAAPPSILHSLADSPLSFVRKNVAEHKNSSDETLRKLADDPSEDVSSVAKKRLKLK